MSRYAKDRTKRNNLPPVKRIELDEQHVGRRLLIAAALLAFGALCIAYGVTQCNAVSAGWTEVAADKNVDTEIAGEFALLYELGAAGTDATSERKALTVAYSDALEHAGQLFSSRVEYEGVVNLAYLSAHPNEVFTVDAELYAAFELLERYGSRDIFMAPIFDDYLSIFMATDDVEVGYFDPRTNAEVRAYFDEVLAFVQDPEAISLELLGDGKVRLRVSDAYLAFCKANGIERVLDLGWLTNAFVVDVVADALVAKGFTHGCISSFDGFARNLDTRADVGYALGVFDRQGGVARLAATMTYPTETKSLITWRTYGLESTYDSLRWYETADGVMYHPYLDPVDGLCRAALPQLVTCSATLGCAEMALIVAPVYIADELDAAALDALAARGIWNVRCIDRTIIINGTGTTLTDIFDGYRVVQ